MSRPSARQCGFLKHQESNRKLVVPLNKPYLLGTDALRCDVVFNDITKRTSDVHCILDVSLDEDRKMFVARVTDKSQFGTFIGETKLNFGESQTVPPGAIISLGGRDKLHPMLTLTLYHPDDILCDYDVTKELSEGGFGTVYFACHRASEKVYAIKKIKQSILNPPTPEGKAQYSKYWLAELEAMRTIDHPHLVSLLDVREYNNEAGLSEVAIIMELASEDLASIIYSRWGLPENMAREATRQVAEGLHYLHNDMQMVHRDVKPENVLVFSTRPFVVKVSDFGFARVIVGGTIAQTMCGTPAYTAPEVVASIAPGSAHYDFKVDSWSLGVMVFVMLCGRFPFREEPRTSTTSTTATASTYYTPGESSHGVSEVSTYMAMYTGVDRTNILWKHLGPTAFVTARDLVALLLKTNPAERLSMKDILAHGWINE